MNLKNLIIIPILWFATSSYGSQAHQFDIEAQRQFAPQAYSQNTVKQTAQALIASGLFLTFLPKVLDVSQVFSHLSREQLESMSMTLGALGFAACALANIKEALTSRSANKPKALLVGSLSFIAASFFSYHVTKELMFQ